MTSEKQPPSPIEIAADIGSSIEAERKASRAASKLPLKDLLGRSCAAFNKMVSNKKHKICSMKRSLIYNLFFGFSRIGSFQITRVRVCSQNNLGISRNRGVRNAFLPKKQ